MKALFAAALALAAMATAPALARPPMPDWQTDAAACSWHWHERGGLGLWAERCALRSGLWQIEWREGAGGFVETLDGNVMRLVVRPFTLPPGGGIGGLPAVLVQAGFLAPDAPCHMTGAAIRPAPRTTMFHVLATLDANALAPAATGDVPDPVCGPLGVSTHGLRYFVTDLRWPGLAIFIDTGQERPIFEPASLTVLP